MPAEIYYERRHGSIITGRVRLFELTEHQILADRPTYLNNDGSIPCGASVTVHFSLGGSRYQFDSVIEETDRSVSLGGRTEMRGIALSKASGLADSQQRSDLRISMVGYDPITVRLARPHPDLPDACPVDAEILKGRIHDISIGGLAVLVDHRVPDAVHQGDHFFLTFVLPSIAEDFCMLGSVRHTRVVKASVSLRMGLSFHPWCGTRFAHDQRRISQFVVEHERRLLRRRR
ncbi:MAG: PilZ domain-containing protein [Phycisphaerales bacterium]|nr:MAG: PilZ domain-containing protein [Phycisphaerales bacterium]